MSEKIVHHFIKQVVVTSKNSWRGRKLVRMPKGYRFNNAEMVSGALGLLVPIETVYTLPSGVIIHANMEAGDRIRVMGCVE